VSDHADIVRERVSHIARGCRAGTSHNPAVYENDINAALDALVAEIRSLNEQVVGAVDLLEGAVAERDELRERLTRAGDSARETIKDALLLKEAAEAENARLREAGTKVADAYTAEAEDHNDGEFALWKADDLVNAIVALRAALREEA